MYFWDRRVSSLEEQAMGPIENKIEMNMPSAALIEKLNSIKGYKTLFKKAFPGKPISKETITHAIATFVRSIVSSPAPFDRWIEGNEQAISPEAKEGFLIFNTKAKCINCHMGWDFTRYSAFDTGLPGDDIGMGRISEPAKFLFKTPTLRNVAVRPPYMHDGSLKTLDELIDFYAIGGKIRRDQNVLEPFQLNPAEKRALIAFLHTLTAPISVSSPVLPQ